MNLHNIMKCMGLSAAAAALCMAACSGSDKNEKTGRSARVTPGRIASGRWAARTTVPGGDIRFEIELGRTMNQYDAVIVNGEDRITVPEVSFTERTLTLAFPQFHSRLELALEGGVLKGTLALTARGGEQTLPVSAVYAQGYRMELPPPRPKLDMTGRWGVTFTDDEGRDLAAVGEFKQTSNNVTGAFFTPSDEYGNLTGTATDASVELGCFDGAHAYLFKATVKEDGSLEGDFWSGAKWHERWIAHRDAAAALPGD